MVEEAVDSSFACVLFAWSGNSGMAGLKNGNRYRRYSWNLRLKIRSKMKLPKWAVRVSRILGDVVISPASAFLNREIPRRHNKAKIERAMIGKKGNFLCLGSKNPSLVAFFALPQQLNSVLVGLILCRGWSSSYRPLVVIRPGASSG